MRTVAVVTTSRADFGLLRPLINAMSAPDSGLQVRLIAAGMHLSPQHGETIRQIEAEGFEIAERVAMIQAETTPEAVALAMGLGVAGYARALTRLKPDILLVLGDRYEMHSAGLAALPLGIPVAHMHGGELTFGAIDDALRHSLTKLSHLHFVATEEYRRRVIQLGEEPWRVTVAGFSSLENLSNLPLMAKADLAASLDLPLDPAPLLVTYHPVTLEQDDGERQISNLLTALDQCGVPVVFTLPNADAGGLAIESHIERFVQQDPKNRWIRNNLGTQRYFSLMASAVAMVGNSSSGISEAPFFCLPVVNIGTRQAGRIRAANVIDVGYEEKEILDGIHQATTPAFRDYVRQAPSPFLRLKTSTIIVDTLRNVQIDDRLKKKKFYDLQF